MKIRTHRKRIGEEHPHQQGTIWGGGGGDKDVWALFTATKNQAETGTSWIIPKSKGAYLRFWEDAAEDEKKKRNLKINKL